MTDVVRIFEHFVSIGIKYIAKPVSAHEQALFGLTDTGFEILKSEFTRLVEFYFNHIITTKPIDIQNFTKPMRQMITKEKKYHFCSFSEVI